MLDYHIYFRGLSDNEDLEKSMVNHLESLIESYYEKSNEYAIEKMVYIYSEPIKYLESKYNHNVQKFIKEQKPPEFISDYVLTSMSTLFNEERRQFRLFTIMLSNVKH